MGLLGSRDGDLVGDGGYGKSGGAVGRHVMAGNDNQVADRLLASDQVESNPDQRKDHGAVQDTVVPLRDAAFTIQVGDRFQIERRMGLPDIPVTAKPAGLLAGAAELHVRMVEA